MNRMKKKRATQAVKTCNFATYGRLGKFYSRKVVKGIAKLWADNEDEVIVLCSIGGRIIEEKGTDYTCIRSHFVEREVNKCIDCGLVENGEKLAALLISPDREFSTMGMEIVYELREKRLKLMYGV